MFYAVSHTQEHGWRKVPCKYCERTFKGRVQLKSHVNKYHIREQRADPAVAATLHNREDFVCNVCGKTFMASYRLKVHLMAHSDEWPLACDHCPQRFKHARNLRLHKLKHTGERNIACPVCDLKFTQAKLMKQHLKRHGETKGTHGCDVCGKVFSYRSGLNEHMNVHTMARTFECKVCQKVFNRVSVLNRHKLMHEEKNFECEVCGKKFGRLSLLRYHQKKHIVGEEQVVSEDELDEVKGEEEEEEVVEGVIVYS